MVLHCADVLLHGTCSCTARVAAWHGVWSLTFTVCVFVCSLFANGSLLGQVVDGHIVSVEVVAAGKLFGGDVGPVRAVLSSGALRSCSCCLLELVIALHEVCFQGVSSHGDFGLERERGGDWGGGILTASQLEPFAPPDTQLSVCRPHSSTFLLWDVVLCFRS